MLGYEAYQSAFPRRVSGGGEVEVRVGDDGYGDGHCDGYGSCMSESDGVWDHGHGCCRGLKSSSTGKVHDGDYCRDVRESCDSGA